jgi:hypothetical protein
MGKLADPSYSGVGSVEEPLSEEERISHDSSM